MSKSEITKEALLLQGRRLFWSRGYSNVSVREIAKAANVDVALISRYFGSKLKLFEATLELIDTVDPAVVSNREELIDMVVNLFVTTPRNTGNPSPITMMLLNAGDSEVGEMVKNAHRTKWQSGLDEIIGSQEQAALFSAALLGFSVVEKSLNLPSIPEPQSKEYELQLRHLLNSAISFNTEKLL